MAALQPNIAAAVSPNTAQPAADPMGAHLFQKDFSSSNPLLGSDGLGPLFNASSCAACHSQGGPGGSGDSRFNVKAVGIDQVELEGSITTAGIQTLARRFHPALMPQGTTSMVATVPLTHFGGSSVTQQIRDNVASNSTALSAAEGGDVSAVDIRVRQYSPISWTSQTPVLKMRIDARVYQRNSTALFGVGLLDSISDRTLLDTARQQQQHPEISGRVSELTDGRIGRFGWRANESHLVDFVEKACVNEMGLQTSATKQANDVANPEYINVGVDISDEQIIAMSNFIASLPAPVQRRSSDSLSNVTAGKTLFAEVGCAVCHVENMDSANGIYSDVLLHDMGGEMYDYDTAEPKVVKKQQTQRFDIETRTTSRYYGVTTTLISKEQTSVPNTRYFQSQTPRSSRTGYDFISVESEKRRMDVTEPNATKTVLEGTFHRGVARKIESTNVSQEWRTPPLWGVADSAPYMHDGRAGTLLEAIAMHGGEAAGTRNRFMHLPHAQQQSIVEFLDTLVAPKSDFN